MPVAYTFPLLGAFVPFLFILFVAWLYGSPLDLSEQIKLIAVGIPSFFGSSKVTVEIALESYASSCGRLQPLHQLRNRAPMLCGHADMHVHFFIYYYQYRSSYEQMPTAMEEGDRLSSCSYSYYLFSCLGGLKMGFSHLLANTYHGSDLISNMELPLDSDGKKLDKLVSTKVYLRMEDVPAPARSSPNLD